MKNAPAKICPHCAAIDLEALLIQQRKVAVIWGIEDVLAVRADLTDDEAWQVLQECGRKQDCEVGFTWDFIECIADGLFPERD